MNKPSSKTTMQDIDALLGSVKRSQASEQLYDSIMLRVGRSRELRVSRSFVRGAAAAFLCLFVAEGVIVFRSKERAPEVSGLVELPDNSLNYE